MRTKLTRRQIETTLAAILAAAAGVVGISSRNDADPVSHKILKLHKVDRFDQPVALAQPPGASSPLFVVERHGTVRVIADGVTQQRPFLDLRRKVKHAGKGGEQGLLSIAFPHDYSRTHRFYVSYSDHRDALRVVEYRADTNDPLRADPRSARLVLRIAEPTTKHHGGQLLFGPDRYLYIGSGDGGPSGDPNGVAQSKRSLLGKLLRIDPAPGPVPAAPPKPDRRAGGRKGKQPTPAKPAPYTIPPDNPFVGRPGRDEIFAYGLRNPWRFSFDRAEDRISIGDVGDVRFEEVDVLPIGKARGANFGWSAYEGNAPLKDGVPRARTVKPTYVYPHGRRCSVVGGYVVRDPRLSQIKGREIVGRYVFGDFCAERIFAFRFRAGKIGKERKLRFELPGVTSFGEDRSGRIYVLTYGERGERGFVYRLDATRKPTG
ncbi:MAG TPA: PQQ-dependent sugar dehydrogenase [Solirubrobacterales bacterium]|jgi:glucose/arabinose dehydrogenase|nr:PQQ-dependent sugar dehydrogenase [Solirubrobacterales bacterium]